jgi:hypothetical protein
MVLHAFRSISTRISELGLVSIGSGRNRKIDDELRYVVMYYEVGAWNGTNRYL